MASSCLRSNSVWGPVVALDQVGHEVDTRRKHQVIIGNRVAALGAHRALVCVDSDHPVMHHLDAILAQALVALGEVLHGEHATDDPVGQRAGIELVVRLDQGDLDIGIPLAQVLGASGAAEAGADDDDPGFALPGEGGAGNRQAGQGGG
jgi:hypothetical protein